MNLEKYFTIIAVYPGKLYLKVNYNLFNSPSQL